MSPCNAVPLQVDKIGEGMASAPGAPALVAHEMGKARPFRKKLALQDGERGLIRVVPEVGPVRTNELVDKIHKVFAIGQSNLCRLKQFV
jgi:hypothetical protein